MHRYYMTAETRQALIAESNRLIAARAATNTLRRTSRSDAAEQPVESDWHGARGDQEASAFDVDSVFARLVQDLQKNSVRFSSP